MNRECEAHDVSQRRTLFRGGQYIADTVGLGEAQWARAVGLLRCVASDGDEVLAVYGEGFAGGVAFVRGRRGRDWTVVGAAECQ